MFELNRQFTSETGRRIASGTVGTPDASPSTALTVAPGAALTLSGKARALVDSSVKTAKDGLKEAVTPERLIGAATLGIPLSAAAGMAVTADLLTVPVAVGIAAAGVLVGGASAKRVVRFVAEYAAAIRLAEKVKTPQVATVALPMPVKAKAKVLVKVG